MRHEGHLLGAHTLDIGGIDMAVRRAAAAGMSALQVFTAIPKFYGDRSTIRPERVERFRAALAESGIAPRHVLAHGAYVLNAATPDAEKWGRATAGLAKELERCDALGLGAFCFHPGSGGAGDRAAAAERVAQAITRALQEHPAATPRVLVENTAGAGHTLGRTAGEVGEILRRLPTELRGRAGYGLDTCHLFASGHDITRSAAALAEVLDAFEEAAGEPPAFFHLNDSEGELGSNRDRHALVGRGRIGVEPFRWLLADRRSSGVPLIVETPQQHPEVAPDDATADPWDVEMMELLRSLLPAGRLRPRR
jgi:deoxyribonuclease IV